MKFSDRFSFVNNKRYIAAGLAAVIILSCSIPNVKASMISTEKPMAGINVPLEQFIVAEVEQGMMHGLTDTTQGEQNPHFAGGVQVVTDTAEQNDELKEEKEEHIKLNLNYDRLGIAKVDTYLNVRKKPNTGAKIVGKLTKNAGCHIYKVKKGWAKIVSGKVNGYVKASYLVKDAKAEELAYDVGKKVITVKESGLRVRALPTTDASIYTVLGLDEDFEVYREHLNAEWLEKFISKYVKKKEVKSVNYDAMVADLANWVCIAVDNDYAFVSKQYVEISYKLKRAVKIGQLSTNGANGVSSTRASIVEYAKQFLGNRYVYGGTSLTNGTDCSGFTMSVFSHFGYGLPRTSGSQCAATRSVSSSEVKPGDLFFYGSGGRINHVALYIGSGMIIHASNPSSGIKISNAYYRQPAKIGRIIND